MLYSERQQSSVHLSCCYIARRPAFSHSYIVYRRGRWQVSRHVRPRPFCDRSIQASHDVLGSGSGCADGHSYHYPITTGAFYPKVVCITPLRLMGRPAGLCACKGRVEKPPTCSRDVMSVVKHLRSLPASRVQAHHHPEDSRRYEIPQIRSLQHTLCASGSRQGLPGTRRGEHQDPRSRTSRTYRASIVSKL